MVDDTFERDRALIWLFAGVGTVIGLTIGGMDVVLGIGTLGALVGLSVALALPRE